MGTAASLEMRRKTLLDRSLSLFTDVRAGEGVSVLLLATNVFYLLAFYSILKVVRDALILSESGAVAASYSSAGQALLLLLFVPAYAALASRVNRVWLISGVTLFFASHLLIFYALGVSGVRVGVAFYVWIGVFNMVAVAQFWAFANDLYDTERGKRLFPLVGVGATLGALVGAGLTAVVFEGTGPYPLMLFACAGLLVPVALTVVVHRRERHASHLPAAEAEKPLAPSGGFELVLRDRYLLLIAALILVYNLVNTLGGFMLNTLIEQEAARRIAAGAAAPADEAAVIGALAGAVQTWVNLAAFILQSFVVSRVFRQIGVRGALFVLPAIAFGGYAAVAILPVLSAVRMTKIFENSIDYSLQNTTRHALFLPTSREAKYKAKQAIDSFFLRSGDMLQAAVVFVGVQLAFTVRAFALVNLALVVVWFLIVVGIARQHRRMTGSESERRAAA